MLSGASLSDSFIGFCAVADGSCEKMLVPLPKSAETSNNAASQFFRLLICGMMRFLAALPTCIAT